MSTKTIIKKSVVDAAEEAVALYAKRVEAGNIRDAAIATLDTLPETKTGKDTKIFKEARAEAEESFDEVVREHRKACEAFELSYRLAVIETNRLYANSFCADKALAKHGFRPDERLGNKLRETTISIRQHNKGVKETGNCKELDSRDKEHGHIHYFFKDERVYVSENGCGGASNLYLVVQFHPDNYTYRISYFGHGPKLTAFGLAFFRNYCVNGMSTFDHNIFEDLRVNLSSIGSEFGPEAVERLSGLFTVLKVAETLMSEAPFVETRNICVSHDNDLMEAIANGETLKFVRRTIQPKGYGEKKGRVNVVLTCKAIDEASLDDDQAILSLVDVNQSLEHTYEDEFELEYEDT